jgi:predicted O-methyltransferase YrrM
VRTWGWVGLVVLALLPSVLVLPSYLRRRAERRQRNVFSRWPIRRIDVSELDPVFARGEFGPTVETEVHFLGGASLMSITGATSDAEAWILAVLSKRARLMFEFGTATGRTAYLWARNSPSDAKVVTLTLSPEDLARYSRETGDAEREIEFALNESRFTRFYYSGTAVESKVVQLFADSKAFDERPWEGQCDLVFVDGSHARSYVESDTRKALRLARPGGLILWHDYRGPGLIGVYEALNALARDLPLVHVAGTSLVAYRKP